MSEVLHGKSSGDKLAVSANKTQVYGLAGNDTINSYGKSDVLLIGGSGNDLLVMTGGNGTLSGGAGADTFEFNFSADKKISAVIEDIDPSKDKIVVNFIGDTEPQLTSVASGDDVVWTTGDGYFNLTLKSSSDASDYFDGTASDEVWEIFRLTNNERESQGRSWLILSQGLTDGASIRSTELVELYSHTRPNGEGCFTVLTKEYWSNGENIAAGYTSPEKVVEGWMNSPGHRANILDENNYGYQKIGVGCTYDASSYYEYHWVQMFGGGLTSPDTLSTAEILSAKIEIGTIAERDIDTTTTNPTSTTTTNDNTTNNNTTRGGSSSTSTTTGGGSSTSTTTGGSSSSSTVDNNQVVYTGGDKIVSNYAGEKIVFGDMYTGATFDETGNFFVGSSTGTLAVQNAMDKLVDIVDASGNSFIKAYTPSTAGVIDGRGIAGYEIINGVANGTDVIFAGDGGSQLWGGSGLDADALVGGNGFDIFVGGRFQGSDNIFNASSADAVNLTDASLSDIVATAEIGNNVLIGFNTGNIISIQSTELLSAAINFADGSSWRYNHATKSWQSA